MKLWAMVMVLILACVSMDADARRMGGGKSFGKQSNRVTQRESATPAQSGNAANAGQKNGAAGAAGAAKPWGGMLGGLAAGLGLAWLASSLGLGAEFGQILLIAMLAMIAFAVFNMLKRKQRAPQSAAATQHTPFAFGGAANNAATTATTEKTYSPANVGNDASARPWERSGGSAFDANSSTSSNSGATAIGSALAGAQTWGIPAGFDTEGFIAAAKENFTRLQDAWDRFDMKLFRVLMTDEMVAEVRQQIADRPTSEQFQNHPTEILLLNAQLLGIEEIDGEYMASVEFSGMLREQASAGPSPFREVWNMTKPVNGGAGWLVAGIQALQ